MDVRVSVGVDDAGALIAVARNAAGTELSRSRPQIVREAVSATDQAMRATRNFGGNY
jgi:hypothetical protein